MEKSNDWIVRVVIEGTGDPKRALAKDSFCKEEIAEVMQGLQELQMNTPAGKTLKMSTIINPAHELEPLAIEMQGEFMHACNQFTAVSPMSRQMLVKNTIR
jgi:hypothetical protein